MSGKSLSNGTLSLRFMQRAKSQAQVEAGQAKVTDDAAWSVSQDVRDAWGLGHASSESSEVQHESSYLPFIFQSDVGEGSSSGSQSESRPQVRGRRTFNARGAEVVAEKPKMKQEEDGGEMEEHDDAASHPDERPRARLEKLPTSISGFQQPISLRKDSKKPRTKTAQMLIHEDASVRPPASLSGQALDILSGPHPATFLKPAGVDTPAPPSRKRDREQGSGADRLGSEGKKKKKRKEKGTGS